jgi:hypothetical protein
MGMRERDDTPGFYPPVFFLSRDIDVLKNKIDFKIKNRNIRMMEKTNAS